MANNERLYEFVSGMDDDSYAHIRGVTLLYERFLWRIFVQMEAQQQARTTFGNAAIRVVRTCERITTLRRRLFRWYRSVESDRMLRLGVDFDVQTARVTTYQSLLRRRFGTIQQDHRGGPRSAPPIGTSATPVTNTTNVDFAAFGMEGSLSQHRHL